MMVGFMIGFNTWVWNGIEKFHSIPNPSGLSLLEVFVVVFKLQALMGPNDKW